MASAFEHKSLQWLREKFETGDIPTGYDFARLIDSCHNSLAHTDSIITGSLTVSGDITCLGTTTGTQSVSAVDPRVSELFTTVQTNSANWSLITGDYTTHYQTLEYLYEKFQSGDSPTEQDFKVLIDNSHNTLAHQNTHLADLLTTVQTNSAYWAITGGGGGGGIDDELRTLVSANSAYWGAHTDISDIVTTVSTNSASWIYGNDIPLEEIYSVVSTSSAGWSSSISIDVDKFNSLFTTVQSNSARWSTTRSDLDELQTYVESNTASWLEKTDLGPVTTRVDGIETYVESNTASWLEKTDLGPVTTRVDLLETDLQDVTSTMSVNSGYWLDNWNQIQNRAIIYSKDSLLPDGTALGFDDDPNNASSDEGSTAGERVIVSASTGTLYVQSDGSMYRVESQGIWRQIDPPGDDDDDSELLDLITYVESKSAQWDLTIEHHDAIDNLENTFGIVQDLSAIWGDHTDVSELETTVFENSASWDTGGNLELEELRTTVDTYSASWGVQTDITDLETLVNINVDDIIQNELTIGTITGFVQTNSGSWLEQADVSDLRTVVSVNSADWPLFKTDIIDLYNLIADLDFGVDGSLFATVQAYSGAWGQKTDVSDLVTLISTNSSHWSNHTDLTSISATVDSKLSSLSALLDTRLDALDVGITKSEHTQTVVETNSSSWGDIVDTTQIETDIDYLSGAVDELNTTTNVEFDNVYFNQDLNYTDIVNITNFLTANSADWYEQTDTSSIEYDVQSLTSVVTANSADWNEGGGIDGELRTIVQDNSADWNEGGGIDGELRTIVQDNSGHWSSHTDITGLTSDLDNITTHVADNSASWSSGTGNTGTGGIGTLDSIKHHVENFYTILPDEIVSYDAATSQEVVLRLFIVDCSGTTNFLYRNVHTTDHDSYWIWFDDTLHGDFTSSDPSGNLLSKNLKWYIDNGRARWNGSGGTSSTSGVDTAVRDLTAGWESTYSVVSSSSADWSSTYSVVETNSAGWGQSTGGGGSSAGAFVTEITCGDNNAHDNGITEPVVDADEIPVADKRPIVSALVDSSDVRFYLQWEGPADEWTGTPTLSGYQIPRGDTSAVGGSYARRFEGYIDLDLSDYTGTTTTIYYEYQGLQKSIDLEIAGGGPEIMKIEFTSTPQHGQDHYKDGDTIEFVVEFNTEDVVSYSLQSGNDVATRSYNNVSVSMDGVSATITAEVQTTVTSITDLPVRIKARNALGTETPNWFESTDKVDVLNGPVIENVTFGAYPGTQTELKDNDTIQATFTFDTTNVNTLEMNGTNNNNYASSNENLPFTNVSSNKQATVVMTVDTSIANNTGGSLEPIRARARHTTQQYGNWHVSVNTLRVNNQKPTFSSPSITYPSSQQAIKNGDDATVNIVVSNQGTSPTYTYTGNGRSELSIPDTSTYTQDKIVSFSAGTYNITAPNYKLEVNRQENDNSDSITTTVFVANVDPEIDVTLHILAGNPNAGSQPARLQSGGNDGTDVAAYEVRVTSNQKLQSFSMDVATSTNNAGTWASGSSWTTTNNTVWKRNIKVDDEHDKGTFNWESLNLENYSGMSKTSFANTDTGEEYVLGGFVSRDITLTKTQNEAEMNVLYETYNKVNLSWSASSDVNTRSPYGTQAGDGIPNNWCLDDQDAGEAPGGPVTIRILDLSKTNAATLADTTITIEETA